MGSMTSRPKAPSVQTVYMPVYNPAPDNTPPVVPAEPNPNPDAEASARRAAGLLERSRSAYGTVLTGFRGLLNQQNTQQRKTLLGE